MRKIYTTIALAIITLPVLSQTDSIQQLNEVVITGQYKPQSLKNSVYQVRVISHERIRLSGANTIQQVLNNQLGFRFSNDNTLGTTDVQLMRMSGRDVKILLDGVPIIDRGDTREGLNQVDINTVDRIEIVEGPMSVSYGSDALAGVINIITKKNIKDELSVTARVQEETAGTEYYPFSYNGSHLQNVGISWRKKGWIIAAGGTHNDFDGFGGDAYGRGKSWLPKEQWLGNVKVGYATDKYNIYYRLDGLDENIISRGPITQLYNAKDQHYLSDRFLHQLQGDFRLGSQLQLATAIAYTDYKRKTRTTIHDFQANTDRLSTEAGEQDVSKLNGFTFRNTLNYLISSKISLQPGIDINREEASGERIAGDKTITDYALFVSAEIKPDSWINIRPGLRFIKNSVYDAPPVTPSINTKFVLSQQLDLRISYGYGFRSPALRELYFDFHDTNHNIDGNPNLKAEHSNSFNGSLNWTPVKKKEIVFSSRLSAFYNQFNNQILLTQSPTDSSVYSYFNVNRSKTAGGTLDNSIAYKSFSATLGFSYIGFASSENDDPNFIKEDKRDFLWTPEINTNITYTIEKIKTTLSFFYKFIGTQPAFATGKNAVNQDIIYVGKTSSYNLADLTGTTVINKYISATIGIKNLFDVTNVQNTASSASVHATNGPLAIGYGRSYFLGLNFQWHK